MLDWGPDHDQVKLVGVAGICEKHVERGEVKGIAAAGGAIDSDHDPASHVVCFCVTCLCITRFDLILCQWEICEISGVLESAQNFSNF